MATRKVERFRSYDSPADCFKDYAALLGNSNRYSDAKGAGADATAFGKALHRGLSQSYRRSRRARTPSAR